MLNRNFAATTAQIAAANRPEFTPRQVPNLGADIARAAQSYNDEQKKQALVAALQGGDETAINAAYARLSPEAAMQQRFNNMAEERRFEQQKELANINNAAALDRARQIAQLRNGLVNINMNNPFDKKRIETIASNMDENISTAQGNYDTYKQALDLLNADDVKTGGVWNLARGSQGKIAGSLLLNDNEQRLNALINETIPKMRPVGSGSASDKDMETFAKATIGFGNTKEANKSIASGRMIAAENAMALEELRANYVTSGKGTVSDFDKEWRRYLNANPIFNDKGGLNKSRVDAYSWFNGNQQTVDPKIQQALDAGYSMDEINAFLGR